MALLFPKTDNLLWMALKKLEINISRNEVKLWSSLTYIMENFAFNVMVQFFFIDMPKEAILFL